MKVAMTHQWSLLMWIMSLASVFSVSHVSSLGQYVVNLFSFPSGEMKVVCF